MQLTARQFRDHADILRLCDFLIAANASGQAGYWHIGDLIWGMFQNTVFEPRRAIRLWEDQDGVLLGFAWLDEPDGVVLQVHPQLRGQGQIEAQMLEWATASIQEQPADQPRELWAKAYDSDTRLRELLEQRGFVRGQVHFLEMSRDLRAPIADPALPDGWAVRAVDAADEWQARVDVHREVWHPSRVTLEAYRALRQAPVYNPALDLVAVAPSGEFASYCICWLDPNNQVGEFEPVGTRAAYRGQGIGKALMLEGLRRMRALGASRATVIALGTNTAAVRLYESIGFQTFDREFLYGKHLL